MISSLRDSPTEGNLILRIRPRLLNQREALLNRAQVSPVKSVKYSLSATVKYRYTLSERGLLRFEWLKAPAGQGSSLASQEYQIQSERKVKYSYSLSKRGLLRFEWLKRLASQERHIQFEPCSLSTKLIKI